MVCRVCKIDRPASDYYPTPAGNPRKKCKHCEYESKKQYIAANRTEWTAMRRYHIVKHKYGITKEQYLDLLTKQDGKCGICRVEIIDTIPHVDHDHACCPTRDSCCGKCVRGLLCKNCNWGLGNFKDSEYLLINAISYLKG